MLSIEIRNKGATYFTKNGMYDDALSIREQALRNEEKEKKPITDHEGKLFEVDEKRKKPIT